LGCIFGNILWESVNKEITSNSNDNKKDGYVYDAPYTKKVSVESYELKDAFYIIRARDIIVPYINLDSKDAKEANAELKKLHDELVEFYNSESNDKLEFKINYTYQLNEGKTIPLIEETFKEAIKQKKTSNIISFARLA
jgi:hypothetical protein